MIMVLQPNSPKDNEDDAMFVKKPLGGFSCASCEKSLNNLKANPADFQPWSKLPFKGPYDRLSKVTLTIKI